MLLLIEGQGPELPCAWQPCIPTALLQVVLCSDSPAALNPCSRQQCIGAECVSQRVVSIDLVNIFACQALEMQNAVFHSICHLSLTILRCLKME